MATLEFFYTNGDYDEFSPTLLSFPDGYLLENEHIIANLEILNTEGLFWERDFFEIDAETGDVVGKAIASVQLATAEQLKSIYLINLGGKPYLANIDGQWRNLNLEAIEQTLDQLQDGSINEENEFINSELLDNSTLTPIAFPN